MNRIRDVRSSAHEVSSSTAVVPSVVAAVGLVFAVLVAGCQPSQGSDPTDAHMGNQTAGGAGHMADALDFGEPGRAAESSRVIEINTLDTMRYEPMEIEVEVGETVTFRVTNGGALAHEFLLSEHADQIQHETEMPPAGGSMQDTANGFFLQPGETKEIVWKFTTIGDVEYGCHVLGHYAAGMVGTLVVK